MIPYPVAIITGANRGIGRSIALKMATLKYQLVLVAREVGKLKSVATEIKKLPGSHVPLLFGFDVTNTQAITGCINEITSKLGRIDVLVNNAGIYRSGSSALADNEFSLQIDTNLKAPFILMKQVATHMKLQQSGAIFNIASRAGKVGFSDSGGYSASKFGLVGLSESFYRELAPYGVSVTAICPGWVDTDMAYEAGSLLDGHEMIQPEDIAKTIEFLLSLSPGARIKEVVIESAKSIF